MIGPGLVDRALYRAVQLELDRVRVKLADYRTALEEIAEVYDKDRWAHQRAMLALGGPRCEADPRRG